MTYASSKGCALVLLALASLAQNPPTAYVESLFAQFNRPSTTDSAAQQIRDLATKDARVRVYMAQKLPAIISANAKGDWQSVTGTWMNAVRLAGQLKLEGAIPALAESLSRGPIRGGYDKHNEITRTFAQNSNLEFDIVGRALADIGDAAVPAVANVLANGDTMVRLRAAWILENINSPAARQAMRDRIQVESDPTVKNLLQSFLK